MVKSSTTWQYVAGLSAGGGALAAGAVFGWSAPAHMEVVSGDAYDFAVTEEDFSWIASLPLLGAATVVIPIGYVIHAIGRKPTMILLVIPFTIGWALLIFAPNVYCIYVARFVLGLASGAFFICAPIYTTEICEHKIRGILGSFFQMLLVTGVLYAYIMGAFLKTRLFQIACAVLPIIFVIFFIFMPESPVYLLSKGRLEAAQKSMAFLRGKQYDSGPELMELQAGIESAKGNYHSPAACLKRKGTLKGLGISIALMWFQQLSGINAIVFYSTDIFSGVDSGIEPAYSTIISGLTMVIFTFVFLCLIDRLGRRILLMVSGFFMAIMTGLLGLYFFLQANDAQSVASIHWLPLASIILFIAMFALGYGATPWVVMAEIFGPEIKDIAGPISSACNALMAFGVTNMFVHLKILLSTGGAFWVFTITTLIGVVFVFFFVPETKGKTLAEIHAELEGKKD